MKITALLLIALLAPIAGCSQEPDSEAPPAEQQPAAEQSAEDTDRAAADAPSSAGEEPATETLATGEGVPSESDVTAPTRMAQSSVQPDRPTNGEPRFREGRHYQVLTPAQPTSSPPDQIEVAEVFWYGCGHCYTFEPTLVSWAGKRPADVSFVRIPAMWNRDLVAHARAYYTAEALGVLDDVHNELYKAIHEQGQRLTGGDDLARFFAGHGVEEQAFQNAFQSFAVETALQRADQLNRRYRINSTPMMVVNGKYVTGSGMAGGYDSLLAIVEYLVERERKERTEN